MDPESEPLNGLLSLSRQGKCHVSTKILRKLKIRTPGRIPYLYNENVLIVVNPGAYKKDVVEALENIRSFLDHVK